MPRLSAITKGEISKTKRSPKFIKTLKERRAFRRSEKTGLLFHINVGKRRQSKPSFI